MAREGAMVFTFTCLAALALLAGHAAYGSALPDLKERFTGPLRREREVSLQQLNTSALNTALAFEPYNELTTRTPVEPGVQQQQQHQRNILFSPLGLASALALLSRASGSESRSQALKALGLAANSTQQSVEATISALTDLQHRLAHQEGGGGGVQREEAEAGAGTGAGTGPAEGVETKGAGAGNIADGVDDGAKTGAEAWGQLRVWSDLHIDGKPSADYDSFLSRLQNAGPSTFNVSFDTLTKDLQASDKLELNNFVYFKGRQPFAKRQTVPRRFKLNVTTSVDVAMMFRDDSSDVMMLYDTNCSATVVQLAQSRRPASLLLLPKAELQPLEDCLSDSRMRFWLSNLKPGRAEILFPKFQLRKSYSLESLLRSSGVSSVFSNSADFSGISPKTKAKLAKAAHKVMLEVEEAKPEDGGRPDIMLDFSVPPRIAFNRPFMLIIYDDLTGLVLLMGRIMDPTAV